MLTQLNYAENAIIHANQINVELLETTNAMFVMQASSDNLILLLVELRLINVFVCLVILMLDCNIVHHVHIIFQDVSNVRQLQCVRRVM